MHLGCRMELIASAGVISHPLNNVDGMPSRAGADKNGLELRATCAI